MHVAQKDCHVSNHLRYTKSIWFWGMGFEGLECHIHGLCCTQCVSELSTGSYINATFGFHFDAWKVVFYKIYQGQDFIRL